MFPHCSEHLFLVYFFPTHSATLFPFMLGLKHQAFDWTASNSLSDLWPHLHCRDSWLCPKWQPALPHGCWQVSAYSRLLWEDVEPACPCGDRSLFLSPRHLEGGYHYHMVALISEICTSHSLPWPCQQYFQMLLSVYFGCCSCLKKRLIIALVFFIFFKHNLTLRTPWCFFPLL